MPKSLFLLVKLIFPKFADESKEMQNQRNTEAIRHWLTFTNQNVPSRMLQTDAFQRLFMVALWVLFRFVAIEQMSGLSSARQYIELCQRPQSAIGRYLVSHVNVYPLLPFCDNQVQFKVQLLNMYSPQSGQIWQFSEWCSISVPVCLSTRYQMTIPCYLIFFLLDSSPNSLSIFLSNSVLWVFVIFECLFVAFVCCFCFFCLSLCLDISIKTITLF